MPEKIRFPGFFLLLTVLLLSMGCTSGLDPSEDGGDPAGTRRLEFGNFVVGSDAVTVDVNGEQVVDGLLPGEFTEVTVLDESDTVELQLRSEAGGVNATVLDQPLRDDPDNLIVIYEDFSEQRQFTTYLMPDQPYPRPDMTQVRFFNLIPDSLVLEAIIDDSLTVTTLRYGVLSVPMVFPGDVTPLHSVYIMEANTSNMLKRIENEDFDNGKTYTGFIWGDYDAAGIRVEFVED